MINEKYARHYCKDYQKIENYDLAINDKTQMWECHHRLETNFSDGTLRPLNAQLKYKELKALGVYYDRPSSELIFLTRKDHRKMHRTIVIDGEYSCNKTYQKAYYKATKDDKRAYYEAHKDEIKSYHEKYRIEKEVEVKRSSKVCRYVKNHGVVSIEALPKKWTQEDILYYKKRYYGENK